MIRLTPSVCKQSRGAAAAAGQSSGRPRCTCCSMRHRQRCSSREFRQSSSPLRCKQHGVCGREPARQGSANTRLAPRQATGLCVHTKEPTPSRDNKWQPQQQPQTCTSQAMKAPCSGEICMRAPVANCSAVAARSSASTAGSRVCCGRRGVGCCWHQVAPGSWPVQPGQSAEAPRRQGKSAQVAAGGRPGASLWISSPPALGRHTAARPSAWRRPAC